MNARKEVEDTPVREYLLDETQAAAFLCLSGRSLQRYRLKGDGPTYTRVGVRRVSYRRSDLIAWIEGRAHKSTTAEGYRQPRKKRSEQEAEARV
jgi:hypothetical protein